MDLNSILTEKDGEYTVAGKYKFIPSFVRKQTDTPKIYTFLHIPKCGGIDFESSYKYALRFDCELNKAPGYIGRADTEKDLESSLKDLAEIKRRGGQAKGIFSSHLGMKRLSVEKDIPLDNVITIIRNPIDRIISAFGYSCMRGNKRPNVENFESFAKKEENINVISNLLSCDENDSDSIENSIRNNFFACITVDQSHVLLSEMLGRYNFANIIKENLNKTLSEFRLNLTDIPSELIDEIKQINGRDVDLYQRFEAEPVLPRLAMSEEINSLSVLLADMQSQEKDSVKYHMVNTEAMFTFFYNNKNTLPDRLGPVIDYIQAL